MPKPVMPAREAERERLRAELRADLARRQRSYRERALALLPHVCASCGREFEGPRLRELTVHHRDHNHLNNPPDGSNWELLCLYCHDHEHEKDQMQGYGSGAGPSRNEAGPGLGNPFAGLDALIKRP